MTAVVSSSRGDQNFRGMAPLGLLPSIVHFGIPTALMFASFHWGISFFMSTGMTSFEAFILATSLPPAWLLLAALMAVSWETSSGDIVGLKRALAGRMRFPRLSRRAVVLSLGVFLTVVLVGGGSAFLGRMVVASGWIPLPAQVPALLDPRIALSASALEAFAGGPIRGRWGIVVLLCLQLFFNIAGEELWWRGYLLPRQELAFGEKTWLIHGLLWWGFHAFKWWDMISILPFVLIISYAAQRWQNNWIPTLVHLLANLVLVVFVVAAVAGGAA